MTPQELKFYCKTSWLAWFFLPNELMLPIMGLPKEDNSMYVNYVALVCIGFAEAINKMGFFRRWLFGDIITKFSENEIYKAYLSIVSQAKQPARINQDYISQQKSFTQLFNTPASNDELPDNNENTVYKPQQFTVKRIAEPDEWMSDAGIFQSTVEKRWLQARKKRLADLILGLRENNASITVLNLRQKKFTAEESRELFNALEDNTTVTQLQFLGNNSSGEAAIALGVMLRKNHTIEVLELGTNEINNADLAAIVSGLKDNKTVVSLDLNSNLFDAASPIADLLEHNNCIKEIDLTNSEIHDDGFLEIRDALQRNEESSLTAFNVYFPSVSCMSDIESLCSANASRLGHAIRPF